MKLHKPTTESIVTNTIRFVAVATIAKCCWASTTNSITLGTVIATANLAFESISIEDPKETT